MASFNATESFNYSDGDLNGQNGGSGFSGAWSGSTNYDVQSTVYPDGATVQKGVINNTQAEVVISRSLSATADSGDIYFSIRRNDTGDLLGTVFRQTSGNAIIVYWLNSGGAISLNGTTSANIVASPTLGVWYDIHLQFVTATTIKAQAKLSTDTTWGSYTSNITLSNSKNGFDEIQLDWEAAAGTDTPFYWARIQPTDPTPPTAVARDARELSLLGVG